MLLLIKMWGKVLVLFVAMICQGSGHYGDLSSLGSQIRAQVAQSLRPMQIQLRSQLSQLDGLGDRINAQVEQNLRPMQTELAGLGDRISQQVYNGLEPVRALELNLKMKNGVGGVTVATVQPSGREFYIKNHVRYLCSHSNQKEEELGSTKLHQSETCSGQLTPFTITKSSPKTDWCYVDNYSQINNRVCLGFNTAVSVEAINNQVNCYTHDGSPVLNIPIEEYRSLCSGVKNSIEYRYYPNLNDPNHVQIPNENKHVRCENRDSGKCVFREANPVLSFYGGSVIINSQ